MMTLDYRMLSALGLRVWMGEVGDSAFLLDWVEKYYNHLAGAAVVPGHWKGPIWVLDVGIVSAEVRGGSRGTFHAAHL